MKGYQITFIAEQGRRVEHKNVTEWLIQLAKELGISGVTTFPGIEGIGSDGRRHSARFIELVDQPIEIMMAVTEQQSDALFERISGTETRLFYVKTPAEYGEIGRQAS